MNLIPREAFCTGRPKYYFLNVSKATIAILNNNERVDYCLEMLDSLQNFDYTLHDKKTSLLFEVDVLSTASTMKRVRQQISKNTVRTTKFGC